MSDGTPGGVPDEVVDPVTGEAAPADLLAALAAYERALAADDLAALDDAFAPGPATLRGDGDGLLVGHRAISTFRGGRGGVAPRRLARVEARRLTQDVWLLVSVSRFAGGGSGLQTQVWARGEDGAWRVTAAHVTGRTRALDSSVWRTVGDPLYQGAWEGPLVGLRVAVKDLFAVKGYRVGAGNPTWLREARRERDHAPAVLDLLRGGASLRGLARTDELAFSIAGANPHHGTPANGALPGALPGGSSSGPATAVATGQADVGLATDTAGSIRVPASYQGLWGLRTTHGLVPRQGLVPLAPSFDTVGWLTRDGATLEAVVRWCLDGAVEDGAGGPGGAAGDGDDGDAGDDEGPAVGLPRRLLVPLEALALAEPDVRSAFEDWLSDVADRHPEVGVDGVSVGDLGAWLEAFRAVQGAEAWRVHGAWATAHPGALGAAVSARLAAGSQVGAEEETAARAALAERRSRLRALLGEDVLLVLPTTPGPAPSRSADAATTEAVRAATLRTTALAGVAGLPALSVPALVVPSPLGPAPVGVCLVGAAGTDLALVRRARLLVAGAATAGPLPPVVPEPAPDAPPTTDRPAPPGGHP
ncbi:AtzH-like domain-containing protein [Cellulomonas endophytica]|uniref:AtzH-like domain-containing protein n=1 Tax=Cellulomonas endophytica TaxID=2494735 RepID=UPI0010121F57|nr:AtzH-like domain-containing protein [Cellulomonas endophytica]